MLDINLFREDKGFNPEVVRESQRKRGASVEVVDEIIDLDNEWKKARFNANETNKKINGINKQIATLMKQKKKDETKDLVSEKANLQKEKELLENIAAEKEKILNSKLMTVGNLVHKSVPVSMDEKDNVIVMKHWPEGRNEDSEKLRRSKLIKADGKGVDGLMSHHELLEKIGGYDSARGANVAGHRGYFLTGPGVDLNLAIIRYGLDFLEKKDYLKIYTPFFMRKEVMAKTAQLEEFDEALYKVEGGGDNDKYLIATSEQPISAYHAGEWFANPETDLPKKYAGQSTCFRKEAGKHGHDTWGIFRVHQFEKIEQFVLTDTEKSWDMHEEMLNIAKEFNESLGLPYQVVAIVSGALNNAAAKKYDLECWFPFQGEYKELVSCSNCTDYQSRRLDIRVGPKKLNDSTKKFAHALNCTLAATGRTICCILENYQTEKGVKIPEVLVPYMNGKTFLPFVADRKRSGSAKKAEKDVADAVNHIKI
ncbi:Cytosolic seryl-tRNA synthetase [Lobulomyces angularis]|nr:Cytosolic seryl-tRNA synthetase [Lobulomyces angularis]